MKLFWTSPARGDLRSLVLHIAHDRPNAALAMWERIERSASGLADHPLRGRDGRRIGTRELVVAGTPYILIYRVREDRVELLRVLHGAQKWPSDGR